MKRLFFLMLTTVIAITVSAQAKMELLDSIRQEPDPMYDRPGRTIWKSDHMMFIINDNNTMEWRLINPPHIFVSNKESFGGQRQNTVKIGLFAENDSLLAKTDKWKAVVSEHGQVLTVAADGTLVRPTGEKIKATIAHIFLTLKMRKGSYVRIVTDVYGDYYYEVKARLQNK